MHPHPSAAAPAPALPPRSRRYRLAGALLLATLLGGSAWWWVRPKAGAPDPESQLPALDLSGAEPAVAQAIVAACANVRREPRSGAAWGRLAKLLLAYDYREEALVCLRRAEEFDATGNPRWPYYQGRALLGRDPDAALPHIRRAVERLERTDATQTTPRLLLAELLLERGEIAEADSQLKVVAGLEPDNPRLVYDLGLLACRRNDPRTARACFTRLTSDPLTHRKACAQLATLCLRLGDAERAREYGRQARQGPPDLPWEDPYVNAYTELNVGRQASLQRVGRLESSRKYGELLFRLEEMAQGANRDHDLTHLALARKLSQFHRHDRAEQALRPILQRNPDHVYAHFALSLIRFAWAEDLERHKASADRVREKYRQAAESARRATQLRHDHALAFVALGRALDRLGQQADALAALRRAVQCRPEGAHPHFYLGQFLAQAGKKEEARQHLDLAIRLADPRDRELATALGLPHTTTPPAPR